MALRGNTIKVFPHRKGPKCSCPLCTVTMKCLCKPSHQRCWQAWQTSLSGGRVQQALGEWGVGGWEEEASVCLCVRVAFAWAQWLVVVAHTTPQFIRNPGGCRERVVWLESRKRPLGLRSCSWVGAPKSAHDGPFVFAIYRQTNNSAHACAQRASCPPH